MNINELQKGTIFSFRGKIYKVLDLKHLHIGRGGAVIQAKIKDIRTGNLLNQTLKPSDSVEEVELEKKAIKFLFSHREKFNFSLADNSAKRFQISKEALDGKEGYLKPGLEMVSLWLGGEFIDLLLPPKVDLKVVEAPPDFKGNTVQGGTKEVETETVLRVKVPMFIKEGDIIRVNTSTGEYTERIK